jgi:phosphate transport system protein
MALQSSQSSERANLQGYLLRLAEAVDRGIIGATWALAHYDRDEAQQVVDGDRSIDTLRYAVEQQAITLLAGQSLLVDDVRAISTVMLIATELERIGDHAAGIASIVLRSAELQRRKSPSALGQMAHKAREMLQQAMRAVVRRDPDVAARLERADDIVDALYQQVLHETLPIMRENPEHAEWATYLLWVGHNLERIADRAVIIGERAAFIVTGVMIRQQPESEATALA